ncbi:ArnT family glycosyltransferase [Leeia aquatica]|uniref:Glycosyltransferase RgtA/B/C/D-like domain-containing protein n=1 Tax=Leeia aquatica TaxID=2725557 RepID=A0A847S987_9NEIS|nr:glycosyltransferase family 39 protein [Leeia aquatica]NLR75517.1 hypothetical protein [Leeia aquatica]
MLTYTPASALPPTPPRDHSWLLLLLCLAWLLPGTFGHAPWRGEEVEVIGVVQSMLHGQWLIPQLNGQPFLDNPPLTYWLAAAFAKILPSHWIALHETARLAAVLMMGLTFLLVGLAGKHMWGARQGRLAVLMLMGCFGLLSRAHLVMPEQAALLGAALQLYGLSLLAARPMRAGLCLGLALPVALLGGGPLALAVSILTLLLFAWPRPGVATAQWLRALLPASVIALPLLLLWPLALKQHAPLIFDQWWQQQVLAAHFDAHRLRYYLGMVPWFAWPAWPLALLALRRNPLGTAPSRVLHLQLLLASLLWILGNAWQPDEHDVNTMLCLPALCLLAVPGLDRLRRGGIAAFNWFGRCTFGLIALLVWLGWLALSTGWPGRIAMRMHRASPTYQHELHPVLLAFALLLTGLWLWIMWQQRHDVRKALSGWVAGATMAWGLIMTLWLPWIVAAKDYQPMLQQLARQLPADRSCIHTADMPRTVLTLLAYRQGIDLPVRDQACRWKLAKTTQRSVAPAGWRIVWQGHRGGDRKEGYWLLKRQL